MTSDAKTNDTADKGSEGLQPAPSRRNNVSNTLGNTFFNLSGGILKVSSQSRVANRFEGLLSQMIGSGSSVRYSRDIEKNLDYLHTSLQLDMLSMAVERNIPREPSPAHGDFDLDG